MNSIVLTEVKDKDIAALGENVVKAMQTLQDTPKRILRFDDAVLARAEINKNRDVISAENLNELAATLPLNWINAMHDTHKRQGFYIAASVKDAALLTSGIVWCDDDLTIPQRLATGELQFSMEADADKAKCSVCGQEFAREKEYCEHLTPIENRFKFNANRLLFGMKALGGALTPKPAGTDTRADPSKLQMIAHVVLAADKSLEDVVEASTLVFMTELEYDLWTHKPHLFADDGFLGKKLSYKERKKLPTSKFALIQKKDGKTIKRFPIHDCAHARNALARLPQAKGLSSAEREQVRRKANAYLNKHCRNKSTSLRAQAVLAAQRFFAMEWANTPTLTIDGQPWHSPLVPPVISPLLYHAGPELVAAPPGQHPISQQPLPSPVEQAAAQAQQAAAQKVQAGKTDTASDERMGALNMTWLTTPRTTEKPTMVW